MSVSIKYGTTGPYKCPDAAYAEDDCVMRRADIVALVATVSGGLSQDLVLVTDVGVFNGVVMKKTRTLTFTNGRLTAVGTETAWS